MSGSRRCHQCGTPLVAKRGDARFCSARCRKRHERGVPSTAPRSGPAKLRSFLERYGLASAGRLSVSLTVALAEINASLERLQARGLNTVLQPFTEGAFKVALRDAGIAAA